jgi:hypothetical protein
MRAGTDATLGTSIMKESKNIMATDKESDMPIFKVAHYGVVGDLNEVAPQLTKQVRAALRSQEKTTATK